MSTGEVIGATLLLAAGAAITAGFWLNLVLWLPMLVVAQMRDQPRALAIAQSMAMLGAFLTVFIVGFALIGLPWYAAAIAGVIVGLTSYVSRPEPTYRDWPDEIEWAERGFDCPVCSHRVETENGLRQHLAAKHPDHTEATT